MQTLPFLIWNYYLEALARALLLVFYIWQRQAAPQ
jgi:hypothetical protein